MKLGPFEVCMIFHMIEEFLIAVISFIVGVISTRIFIKTSNERLWFFAFAFFVFVVDSITHSFAHLIGYDQLVWFSLVVRFLGYGLVLFGILLKEDRLRSIKPFAITLVAVVLLIVIPFIHNAIFPPFASNRYIMWLPASVLSAIITIIFFVRSSRTKSKFTFYMGISFAIITIANIILSIPIPMENWIWVVGHAVRLIGFISLPFALKSE